MSTKSRLIEDFEAANSLRFLAQAYEQISVVKMQQIRRSVLKTRDFLDRLADVFVDVKGSYKNKILELIKKKKNTTEVTSFSTLAKNDKSVAVLISANTRLYGSIVYQVFDTFSRFIKEQKATDVVIVGKIGKELFEAVDKRPYAYFELPDNDVSFAQLESLVGRILNYKKVTVFYGQFINVLNQTPKALEITGEQSLDDRITEQERNLHFLFEPSLENILNFFETQFFTSSFKQTVNETQLARYASRIDAMEQAIVSIDKKIKNIKYLKLRAIKDTQNKKQQQKFAGVRK
ncbi:F0F1 ATP synthase subunit gamma [Candidatus Daviesbacteria bacterium]|nr:F0F1 ATP synthase subunit gamma [Candidatus Daviesbacteria bacterium]